MANKKPKVVFTFVEAGLGHIIPASAMYQAFNSKYGDKCEVVKSYIFSESKSEKVNKMGTELSTHTKRAMKNKLYNKLEGLSYLLSSKITLKFLDRHFRYAHEPFFEDLKALNPDLIVSTYYKPSHLANLSNQKGLTNTLIATYTPDPYVYPAWDRRCDLFMVNNHLAYATALKKGFSKEIVKQVPFVFNSNVVGLSEDREQVRKSLGIDNDKYTVLFTNGAYGAKNTLEIFKRLVRENLDINLIVVCGKNQKLLSVVNAVKEQGGLKTKVHVVGFTERLADYIRASNVVIGKSGMNTPMECIYLKTPMIICSEASRLEELTTKFFLEENLVVKQTSPKKIVRLVKELSNGLNLFSDEYENFEKYSNPYGAERCADELYKLLKTRFPEL